MGMKLIKTLTKTYLLIQKLLLESNIESKKEFLQNILIKLNIALEGIRV